MSSTADNDVRWLFDTAKRQLDACTVDRVVAEFVPVLSEFEAYVESVAMSDAYRGRLSAFIDFLKSAFELSTTVMLVQTNKYSTDMWGPLYWSFLHYASILLQYALHTGLTDDVKEFPTLVYNVDKMLPCSICIAHYLSVKRQNDVRYLIKMMSFGHVIQGVYLFHNVISENVRRHRYATAENAPPSSTFSPIDFAKRYHCYPLTTSAENAYKSSVYSRPGLDWQPSLHLSVSVILVVNYNVSYSRVSNYVKRVYGSKKHTSDELELMYPRPTVYTDEDRRFEYDTPVQDVYDVLVYGIANRRPKIGKESENEEALAYVRQAADTIRTAFSVSGRKLRLTTHNAVSENDMFGKAV